jgi:hypothetical protein
MKAKWTAVLLAAALSGAALPAHAQQQNRFSDIVCPNATQPVRDYDAVRREPHPVVNSIIIELFRVIDAYETCATERLTEVNQQTADGRAEMSSDQGPERAHYAQVRAAQYHVVMGRLWRLRERMDAAHASFDKAIALVKDAIDWRSSSQVTWRSNNRAIGSSSTLNHQPIPSAYSRDATAVRDAALKEIALLAALAAPGDAPSAAPGNPLPAPSDLPK